MAILDQIRAWGLTPVQVVILVAGGLVGLAIAFKVAKLAIKLLVGLVALGLLGLGVLWLLARV
jgi:CHASE2 domain-containing sensor protein